MPHLTPWNPVLLTPASSAPSFLSRSNHHIPHLPVGEEQVIFWLGPYKLKVLKTGPTDADATLRFALGGVIPPTRPAMAWQLINTIPASRPPKQAKSGVWCIKCPCDVHACLWATYLVESSRCMPFSREFRTNLASISQRCQMCFPCVTHCLSFATKLCFWDVETLLFARVHARSRRRHPLPIEVAPSFRMSRRRRLATPMACIWG